MGRLQTHDRDARARLKRPCAYIPGHGTQPNARTTVGLMVSSNSTKRSSRFPDIFAFLWLISGRGECLKNHLLIGALVIRLGSRAWVIVGGNALKTTNLHIEPVLIGAWMMAILMIGAGSVLPTISTGWAWWRVSQHMDGLSVQC